jgi:hypothetical protein
MNKEQQIVNIIDRDALLIDLSNTFQEHWNLPCSKEDRVIQRTLSRVLGVVMSQRTIKDCEQCRKTKEE